MSSSLIADQEEGVYAWVAANYALGTLGKEPQETTGIVELGGASLQVLSTHSMWLFNIPHLLCLYTCSQTHNEFENAA